MMTVRTGPRAATGSQHEIRRASRVWMTCQAMRGGGNKPLPFLTVKKITVVVVLPWCRLSTILPLARYNACRIAWHKYYGGDQSKQGLWDTQKPLYFAFFTIKIQHLVLLTMVYIKTYIFTYIYYYGGP